MVNLHDMITTAKHALSDAQKVGVNDPAIVIVDPMSPTAFPITRRLAPVPEVPDAVVVTWARKVDVARLIEEVVPGSDTAKVIADQLSHDRPYLLTLGDKIVIGPWDLSDPFLVHVTLNTGHSASIPRDFVTQETLSVLGPLVRGGGGRIPNMPFEFSIVEYDGAATLDVQYICEGRAIPVIVGTVCEKRSEEWWKHLLRTAKDASVERELAEPLSTPWLGIVILPSPALILMSPHDTECLGGLENSVAWTWLRRQEAGEAK